MTQQPGPYPGTFSRQRLTTLFASLLVALCAGTNYGYSAYSPQLRERLRITHTQVNIVGLAGNYGVYGSAPLWGRIIDRRGPKTSMLCAFALLLTGYSGIRYIYVDGVPDSAKTISTFTFATLVLCGLMTGAGGNGGLTGAVNSSAKTFPDNLRATATGVVVSGFGLSAFFFSNIARLAFPGNTASFLSLLAFGTSVPMLVGFFLVRPIPLPPHPQAPDEEAMRRSGELAGHESENRALLNEDEVELSDGEIEARTTPQRISRRAALRKGILPNVYGSHLFKSVDFWTLFSILSLLAGTGLMYMNNVGDMAQALYANETDKYDPIVAAHWQADQVSAISLMNCLGRILIGLISDYSKHRFGFPRSYGCMLVSFLYLSSQIAAIRTEKVINLWFASSILGLAHGAVFALFPMVTLDWFGMPHFSENWGFISASPVVASNLYSIYFGKNLDAHSGHPANGTIINPADESLRCLQGRLCYVDALYVTAGGCTLALGLSVWASMRDKRKIMEGVEAQKERERNEAEVVWESVEGHM